ncbi:hypothetical protein T07_11171 [Trichinella nelsoni]|uniref:Uncharacterized protein n=1 Tax=Trichinella nelsoni TaxID=6336 RepID=A0A0V0RHC8_9BILA|nr:hypothetical protein T07_11171 [Trichinella nelsoni]
MEETFGETLSIEMTNMLIMAISALLVQFLAGVQMTTGRARMSDLIVQQNHSRSSTV